MRPITTPKHDGTTLGGEVIDLSTLMWTIEKLINAFFLTMDVATIHNISLSTRRPEHF
jgi:hypothetical protein